MIFYYLLVVLTALLSAFSQILLNLSNTKQHNGRIFEYINVYVISSYIILAVVILINSYVLKYIPMMEGHVIAASTYFFVLILSRIILKEPMTINKIVGNAVILIGIFVFTI